MTGARSFIDILFILLLAMLVMLTRSVELGAVETDLLRVGTGGLSPIRAGETQFVTIEADVLTADGASYETAESLGAALRHDQPVLLVTAEKDVSFRHVMDVWSTLRGLDHDVRLGAAPKDAGGTR